MKAKMATMPLSCTDAQDRTVTHREKCGLKLEEMTPATFKEAGE